MIDDRAEQLLLAFKVAVDRRFGTADTGDQRIRCRCAITFIKEQAGCLLQNQAAPVAGIAQDRLASNVAGLIGWYAQRGIVHCGGESCCQPFRCTVRYSTYWLVASREILGQRREAAWDTEIGRAHV